MGQAEIAVIAVLSFAAGFVFRHAWPLFVAWQEERLLEAKFKPGNVANRPGLAKYTAPISEEPHHSPPRRRLGLAEMRARKESESFKPLEHQAQVTQNNIAAMEGK